MAMEYALFADVFLIENGIAILLPQFHFAKISVPKFDYKQVCFENHGVIFRTYLAADAFVFFRWRQTSSMKKPHKKPSPPPVTRTHQEAADVWLHIEPENGRLEMGDDFDLIFGLLLGGTSREILLKFFFVFSFGFRNAHQYF